VSGRWGMNNSHPFGEVLFSMYQGLVAVREAGDSVPRGGGAGTGVGVLLHAGARVFQGGPERG